MNKQRRTAIKAIIADLEQFESMRADLAQRIEEVKEEEEEAKENLPESLQEGEKGQMMDGAINALDSAYDPINDLDVQDIINNLEEASA